MKFTLVFIGINKIKNAGSILLANFLLRQWEITLKVQITFCRHLDQQNFFGLSVNDFLKRHSLIKITKTGIKRLGPSVINLAQHENLEGHAKSVKFRLKRNNNVKQETLELKGKVTELLPNAMFRVKLENNHEILATLLEN